MSGLTIVESVDHGAESLTDSEAEYLSLEIETEDAAIAADRAAIKSQLDSLTARTATNNAKRQRVSGYALRRLAEIKADANKYTKILSTKQNALLAPSNTSAGKRHGKGCQTGELRAKGGVCQLCQSLGQW